MKDKDGIMLLKEVQGTLSRPARPSLDRARRRSGCGHRDEKRRIRLPDEACQESQLLEQIGAALKVSGFASVTEDWRAGIITRNAVMEERLSQALMAASPTPRS